MGMLCVYEVCFLWSPSLMIVISIYDVFLTSTASPYVWRYLWSLGSIKEKNALTDILYVNVMLGWWIQYEIIQFSIVE